MTKYAVVTTDHNGKRFNRQYAVVDMAAREAGRDAVILETNDQVRALLCRDENNRDARFASEMRNAS